MANIQVLLGISTIISLFFAAGFGLIFHRLKRPVFRFHKFFAYLTLALATTHAIFVLVTYL